MRVLVAKDGMIVYNKSFGWYDSRKTRKVTDDAVYDLASVSKATGTLPAVMKAYDDGLIRLNSPISAYVPALRGSNKSDFTVEELLYHQSGITPYIAFYQNARSDHSYMCDDGTSQCADTSRNALHASSLRTSSIGPSWLSDSPKPGYTTEVARRMYVHVPSATISCETFAILDWGHVEIHLQLYQLYPTQDGRRKRVQPTYGSFAQHVFLFSSGCFLDDL